MQSLDMEVESMPLGEDDWQNLGYFPPEQDIEDAQASFSVPPVVAHPAPVEEIPSPPLSPLVSRVCLSFFFSPSSPSHQKRSDSMRMCFTPRVFDCECMALNFLWCQSSGGDFLFFYFFFSFSLA